MAFVQQLLSQFPLAHFHQGASPTIELLLAVFSAWFWLGARERLPAYYDENPISFYSDGIFQLHLAGIRFNNRNWPHVVKCLRSWSVASMLIVPLPCALLLLFEHPMGYFSLLAGMLLLIAYLAGLFVPLYATAKKYESCRRFSQD